MTTTTTSPIAIDRTWTVQGPVEGLRNLVPDFLGKSFVSARSNGGPLELHAGVGALARIGRFLPGHLVPKSGRVDLLPAGPERTRVRIRLEAAVHPAAATRTRRVMDAVMARLHADLEALYGLEPESRDFVPAGCADCTPTPAFDAVPC